MPDPPKIAPPLSASTVVRPPVRIRLSKVVSASAPSSKNRRELSSSRFSPSPSAPSVSPSPSLSTLSLSAAVLARVAATSVISLPETVMSSSLASPVIVTVPPAEAPSMIVACVMTISPSVSRISASFSNASPIPAAKVIVLSSALEFAKAIASRREVSPSFATTSSVVVTTRLQSVTCKSIVSISTNTSGSVEVMVNVLSPKAPTSGVNWRDDRVSFTSSSVPEIVKLSAST